MNICPPPQLSLFRRLWQRAPSSKVQPVDTIEPACGTEPEKLVYVSFGEKNNLGGLKHRNMKRKRVGHYINEECPSRCLVRLYKKYVGKCSSEAIAKDIFYLSPRRKYFGSDKGTNKLFS